MLKGPYIQIKRHKILYKNSVEQLSILLIYYMGLAV